MTSDEIDEGLGILAGAIADAAIEGREIAKKKKPAKAEADES